MEYNTTRGKLILPEYGRNVQNMIAHAMEIADRDERNRAAQAIIEVMGQLNPHLRDVDDFRHKLWTHLFVMSDFKLDVDSPYEIPKQEVLNEKPQIMEYPKSSEAYSLTNAQCSTKYFHCYSFQRLVDRRLTYR